MTIKLKRVILYFYNYLASKFSERGIWNKDVEVNRRSFTIANFYSLYNDLIFKILLLFI